MDGAKAQHVPDEAITRVIAPWDVSLFIKVDGC